MNAFNWVLLTFPAFLLVRGRLAEYLQMAVAK